MSPNPFVIAGLAAVAGLAACGGAVAEAPLAVPLGLSHDQAERALREHQFCLETSSAVVKHQQRVQRYPRCKRTAAEHGDAWVIARYDGDRLVELRRYERYGDDDRAIERWNELIAERLKTSPVSEAALQQINDKGLLQAGTRSVKAFEAGRGTVVGVYLLTPSPPDQANVLEQVTYAKTE
jgi:hypothetical protein